MLRLLLLLFCMASTLLVAQNSSSSITERGPKNPTPNEKRFKIGDEVPTNIHTAHPYNPTGVEGVVFEKEFFSKNSAYIKIYFKDFNLAPGDYVEITGHGSGETILYAGQGKIIDNNMTMISDFWSQVLFDERVTVRLHSKVASNFYGFEIETVAYGYPLAVIDQMLEQKSICGNDDKEPVVCHTGTQMYDKGRAVCRLIIGGSGSCTGWLLGCDGHIMTNEHCIGNATDAANTDFVFNYQNTNCNGTGNSIPDIVSSSATFIKTNAALDYTLVQLPTNPTGTYGNLSLSSAAPAVNDRIYIVQHPGGRRKEIAVTTDLGGNAGGFAIVNTVNGTGCRYYADTEQGSSGSPVLDYNTNLVIAIHNTGGCTNGSAGRSDQLITDIGSDMPNCGIDSANVPVTPCSNVITSFPYNESFENTFGLWVQNTNDDFNWATISGGTPTSNTGPTAANDGNFYAYAESSAPNYPSKTAILESPCFNLTNVSSPELRFDYHMYGFTVGNLILEASIDGAIWGPIWSKSLSQGTAWQSASVNLAAFSSSNEFRVRFVVNTSNGGTGDIAIDAFSIAPFSCSVVNNFPYTESFENTLGDWYQEVVNDDVDWINQTGATQSNGTGPSAADDGSYYIYIEASSPNFPTKAATIYSPCFDMNAVSNPQLSFKTHMFGTDIGTLNLEASVGGGAWTSIWSQSGDQGNIWSTQTVSLTSYATASDLQLRFTATTANGWAGDIAIDAIRIETAPLNCVNTFPYIESFESNNTGNWAQNTGDDLDWTVQSDSTPSSSTGPFIANDGTFYAYIEASGQNVGYPTKSALLTSPCFDLSIINNPEFIFSYLMRGANMGTLSIEANIGNATTWTPLWSQVGESGATWIRDTLDLSAYSNATDLRLRFNGVTGTGWSSDIAIDNFYLNAGAIATININTLQNNQFLNIMPNPFGDYLYIETNITNISEYSISNIQGQIVQQGQLNSQTIPTPDLAKGVYFISFTNGEQHITKKIVKQ